MEKSFRPPIRVLLISTRTLVRAGLAALVRGQPQIELVDEIEDVPGDSSLEFDVALLDGSSIPQSLPFRFIALLSDPNDARRWLDAGAMGCILESASVEELLNAIRQVARGETFLSPALAKQIVASLVTRAEPREPSEPLTDRERDVLQLLAQGLSNKDIAQKLYLSVRTVEGHLANIYGKLRVKSRTEAALWAAQRGPDKS